MHREAEEIARWLRTQYLDARVLPDGSVAVLQDLLFTRAILLACDDETWKARFCFENRDLATAQFAALQGASDTPTGFIATRDFR